jgi:hypothetical protein
MRALPESLSQCTLLEALCVPRPPPAAASQARPVRALRRCACMPVRRAGAGPPRLVGRGGAERARERGGADRVYAAGPTGFTRRGRRGSRGGADRVYARRGRRGLRGGADRVYALSDGPRAARRGRTVGAQGRVEPRARGAAGGGRLAQPD